MVGHVEANISETDIYIFSPVWSACLSKGRRKTLVRIFKRMIIMSIVMLNRFCFGRMMKQHLNEAANVGKVWVSFLKINTEQVKVPNRAAGLIKIWRKNLSKDFWGLKKYSTKNFIESVKLKQFKQANNFLTNRFFALKDFLVNADRFVNEKNILFLLDSAGICWFCHCFRVKFY